MLLVLITIDSYVNEKYFHFHKILFLNIIPGNFGKDSVDIVEKCLDIYFSL